MANIRRSLAFSTLDSYLSLMLQLGSTVVLSRLLTPEETGIFAVATVFASLASTFRDFGVAEFLIQEKSLTADKIRAALTVNIAISWIMAFGLFFGAPFVATFYRSPGIADVMRVQSFSFLLIPFGAVTMAYFRREMRFGPIFIVNTTANLVSFAVSIACALSGMGYMSLAWSSLVGVACTVLGALWFRPADFPRWPGLAGVAEVLHFGKFASGIYLLGQLGRGAPEMIIGRVRDMSAVAIFSRANGLVEIFNRLVLRAVMPVCLPYFSKSHREQGGMLPGYLTSVSYLTAIGWPFLLFAAIVSYALIRIVYGIQWVESAPLAKIICAAAAVELVYHLAKEALLARGDAKASNALQLVLQGGLVAGLLAVVPFGLVGAAWGLLAASVVGAAWSHCALSKAIGLTTRDVLRHTLPSLYVALVSVLPVAVWATSVPITENNYIRFALLGGASTVLLWLLSLRYFRHPLWLELARLGASVGARVSARLAR